MTMELTCWRTGNSPSRKQVKNVKRQAPRAWRFFVPFLGGEPWQLSAAPPTGKNLERLREIFLKAETDIINEIGRLRSMGNVDYHAVAALERVQRILHSLENDCWEYVPKMVEKQFYVRAPKARRIAGETVEKHIAGYKNAAVLTADQYAVVDKLVQNLMGEITAANATVISTLQNALIGRPEADFYRRAGIEATAAMEAAGKGVYKTLPEFIQALRREGVTAFVDKAGRHWSLHAYGSMVCRTTSGQAEVLAVLTARPLEPGSLQNQQPWHHLPHLRPIGGAGLFPQRL